MQSWGAKILSSATTVEEARWLEAHGVDAIIAQGLEAGGHRGMFLSDDLTTQVGTFALVPQIVRAVRVPVIAAGGIADARRRGGGAGSSAPPAVQVGTAYLLCPEATTSAVHRAALKSDAAQHTALTNVFTGRPARGIVNRVDARARPDQPMRRRFRWPRPRWPRSREGRKPGLGDFSPLWAGQNTTGCRGSRRRSHARTGRESLSAVRQGLKSATTWIITLVFGE